MSNGTISFFIVGEYTGRGRGRNRPPSLLTPGARSPSRLSALRALEVAVIRMSVADQAGPTKMLQFAKLEVNLGRLPENDVVLHGPKVSKKHATIKYDPATKSYLVIDHNSTNGVQVNGKKVEGQQALKPGDKINVGGCLVEVATQPLSAREIADAERGEEARPAAPERERRGGRAPAPVELDNPDTVQGFPGEEEEEAPPARRPEGSRGNAARPAPAAPVRKRLATDDLLDEVDALVGDEPAKGPGRLEPTARGEGRAPGAGSAPKTSPALLDLLRRYVEWDEKHRAAATGEACRCGTCLLCKSRSVLREAGVG